MSMRKIRLPRHMAFLKPLGRVVAIHPVAPHSEAEKWQKEACEETIWLQNTHAHMPVYMRLRALRLWYTMRVWRVRVQVS